MIEDNEIAKDLSLECLGNIELVEFDQSQWLKRKKTKTTKAYIRNQALIEKIRLRRISKGRFDRAYSGSQVNKFDRSSS